MIQTMSYKNRNLQDLNKKIENLDKNKKILLKPKVKMELDLVSKLALK